MGKPRSVADCRGVVVRRRGRNLVGPIDLRVGRGEFWGVVGPNGAGKTTLLRALAGLEAPDEGEVEVFGKRGRIGFLFQHHDFVPEVPLTVEDVVGFGRAGRAGLGPWRRAGDRRSVDEALELLGLASLRRRLYRELSGGERQKVQLARLAAQEAELLLLDEPAAGLDLEWQERMTALVAELHRQTGAAVVMVTHEVDRLPACCARVLLLRRGRALAVGAPAEVFTPPTLGTLYGCEMAVTEHRGRYHASSLGPAPR